MAVFVSGVPLRCMQCAAPPPFLGTKETYDAPSQTVVGSCRCSACACPMLYTRKRTTAEAGLPQFHLQPMRTKESDMSDEPKSENPLRLFNVGKVGLMLDDYHPGVEKRNDETVKTLSLTLRVMPLTAALAAALPNGVRNLLFTLDDPKPKAMVGRIALDLGMPRQNLLLFASTDTTASRLMLPQAKIKGVYARLEKGQVGYAFIFQAVFGPVDKNELEYIHAWRGAQQFVTFEESEPLLFETEKKNARATTPGARTRGRA